MSFDQALGRSLATRPSSATQQTYGRGLVALPILKRSIPQLENRPLRYVVGQIPT